MSLDRFISLLAASIGLIGAVFLCIGVLVLSDKEMVGGTFNYSPISWPSVEIISSLATQKVHAVIGIAYIVLAFLLHLVSLVFLKGEICFTTSRLNGVLLSAGFIAILILIGYLADGGLCEYHKLNMKKIAARDYLKQNVEQSGAPQQSGVQSIANQYFSFEKEPKEDNPDFIRRFAQYVGYDLSKDADLSKFR